MEYNEKKSLETFESELKDRLESLCKDVMAYRKQYNGETEEELVVRLSATVDSDGYICFDIKDSDNERYDVFSSWYKFADTAWKKGTLASGTYAKVV